MSDSKTGLRRRNGHCTAVVIQVLPTPQCGHAAALTPIPGTRSECFRRTQLESIRAFISRRAGAVGKTLSEIKDTRVPAASVL
ncbi:hypothetical protein MTBUT4_120105 [Magnetospirillum sp. UT-4]|nr:hypothetical protein MTBUT4_120105 [Magnetospirillum sp. UT-4]